MAGHDPGLAAGLAVVGGQNAGTVDPFRLYKLDDPGPGLIVADDPGRKDFSPQRAEVADDVAGPAQNVGLRADLDHLHRGLGRDTLHPAPEVLVEHQIADDQNAPAGEEVQIQALNRIHHRSVPSRLAVLPAAAKAEPGSGQSPPLAGQAGSARRLSRQRADPVLWAWVQFSRMKITSSLTLNSIIWLSSTATRCSRSLKPVMPRNVLVARSNPTRTASSKLTGEAAMISVTRATLLSATLHPLLI